MDSPQFDGILGPIFLLTLPFLAGLRRWETPVRVILVYALLTFLFWASSAQQIRYLIPLFPLLALVTGAIMTRYRNRKRIFALLLCIVAASLAFNGYHIIREFMKIAPLRVAVGIESRDEFLSRTLPHYPMYRFVNRNLPPDARVFLLYMKNYTFLCDRDCYADSMFEAHTLQKILQRGIFRGRGPQPTESNGIHPYPLRWHFPSRRTESPFGGAEKTLSRLSEKASACRPVGGTLSPLPSAVAL